MSDTTPQAIAVVSQPRLVRKVLRNPLGLSAVIVLSLLTIVAILQPWIMPFPPDQIRLSLTNAPPLTSEFVLGGDRYGRDILSRLIASTRQAVISALIVTTVAVLLGVVFGLVAGYFGKLFDNVGSWVFSVLMAAPNIIILIALYTVVGASPNIAMAALGVLAAPGFFWLTRTLTRTIRGELYVDAARVAGLSNTRIVGRHVLMAIRAPIVIMASFLAGAAISIAAGLEFLGLGDINSPSWGQMLTDAFVNVYLAPIQLVWPGAALGAAVAAFVLLGNAVRDALEGTFVKPGKKQRERELRLIQDQIETRERAEEARELVAETGPDDSAPLLRVEGLRIAYTVGTDVRTVVDDVSFTVADGEVVGLVGESGSGKTQTVFAALGLLPEQAIVAGGSIALDGIELVGMPERELRRFRGGRLAYIPQEPLSNLDPSFRIGSQLVSGIRAQTSMSRREAQELALTMLDRVGIVDPLRTFRSYPHEISGGMAQRVLIAGAVATKPRLLIADEPTTALDVTVQAEVLDLLRDLQAETGMGVLIVTHNFGVVADLCDRVVVMRQGRVVESGTVDRIFGQPRHEYTRTLLDSILDHAPAREDVDAEREGANRG